MSGAEEIDVMMSVPISAARQRLEFLAREQGVRVEHGWQQQVRLSVRWSPGRTFVMRPIIEASLEQSADKSRLRGHLVRQGAVFRRLWWIGVTVGLLATLGALGAIALHLRAPTGDEPPALVVLGGAVAFVVIGRLVFAAADRQADEQAVRLRRFVNTLNEADDGS